MNAGHFTSERTAQINRARAIGFDGLHMPEPNSGCWLWIGALTKGGYGHLHDPDTGTTDEAHRYSWKRHKGPIPSGLFVLHRCDVRPCVNPDHLFLGTHDDNMADMIAKGRARHPKGENNHNAKLTEQGVLAIRADSRPHIEIAADFGISPSHVSNLKARRSWKDL